MNTSVFPEIFSLTLLICLFQPIVSRVTRNSNTWILGWAMLLVHYAACVPLGLGEPWGKVSSAVALISLPLAGLFFLRAAGNHREHCGPEPIDLILTAELAVPLLLQSILAVSARPHVLMERMVAVLLLAGGLHVLLIPARRSQPITGLTAAFGAAGLTLLWFADAAPGLVANLLLCLLFLAIAWVYVITAFAITRASVIAVISLVGWGFSYPLADLVARRSPTSNLDHMLLELPQYVFAAAIVLALIEQLLARVEHMAMHDALTGLPNRRRFEEHVKRAMAHTAMTQTPLALLVIDVDDFKHINDTLGHHVGDELLRALAVRLSWHIGPEDILARTGGDEFTAILAGVNDEHHLRFVARAMMSAASVPFMIDGESIDFSISIGLAVAPIDAEDGRSLQKAADQAMYEAKGKGGGRLVFAGEHQLTKAIG